MNEKDIYDLIDQEEEKLGSENPWLYELPVLEDYGKRHARIKRKTKNTKIR